MKSTVIEKLKKEFMHLIQTSKLLSPFLCLNQSFQE